jgi:spermidine synthase
VATPAYTMDILKAGFEYLRNTLGNAQVFRAAIPTYIGGDMGFVIASKSGHCCDLPFREHFGRYYNPQVHTASFALPAWWADELNS